MCYFMYSFSSYLFELFLSDVLERILHGVEKEHRLQRAGRGIEPKYQTWNIKFAIMLIYIDDVEKINNP